MVFCTELNFFLTVGHIFIFFNFNLTKLSYFLPNQNNTLKPDYLFLFYDIYVKQNIFLWPML